MSWRCDICGLIISSQIGNLNRHIALHGPLVLRYECILCGQRCSNKYNFRKHCLRLHQLENEEDVVAILSLTIDNANELPQSRTVYSVLSIQKERKEQQSHEEIDKYDNELEEPNQQKILNGMTYKAFLRNEARSIKMAQSPAMHLYGKENAAKTIAESTRLFSNDKISDPVALPEIENQNNSTSFCGSSQNKTKNNSINATNLSQAANTSDEFNALSLSPSDPGFEFEYSPNRVSNVETTNLAYLDQSIRSPLFENTVNKSSNPALSENMDDNIESAMTPTSSKLAVETTDTRQLQLGKQTSHFTGSHTIPSPTSVKFGQSPIYEQKFVICNDSEDDDDAQKYKIPAIQTPNASVLEKAKVTEPPTPASASTSTDGLTHPAESTSPLIFIINSNSDSDYHELTEISATAQSNISAHSVQPRFGNNEISAKESEFDGQTENVSYQDIIRQKNPFFGLINWEERPTSLRLEDFDTSNKIEISAGASCDVEKSKRKNSKKSKLLEWVIKQPTMKKIPAGKFYIKLGSLTKRKMPKQLKRKISAKNCISTIAIDKLSYV